MPRNLEVAATQELTQHIRLIEFVAVGNAALPTYSAGAHIDFDLGDIGTRSYSLIDWSIPSLHPRAYVIAVQREDDGDGGSAHMHQLTVGQTVLASAPKNDFELANDEAPSVLLAGGIGVTPLLSMAATLKAQGRTFGFHYAGRSRQLMSFVDEITSAFGSSAHIHCDDESAIDLASLFKHLEPETHVYICGPRGMIDAARSTATAGGIASQFVHIELFSTPTTETTDSAFEVELKSTGVVYTVPVGKTIIEALEDEGVDLIYDCQRGDCGICQTDVISGTPDHRDVVLSDDERASGKVMQICVSRARSPRLVLDL